MNPGLVVKLRPSGPWRIGPDSGARNRVDAIYHSDSLYSAVTSAMARLGLLEEWLQATVREQAPAVCCSSCFPFLDEIGFVVPPRTVWPPRTPSLMSARVRWKSARFVPLDVVRAVLAGEPLDENQWSVDAASECLVPTGRSGPFRTGMRWSAAVDRLTGSSERHSIACIEFRPGCGLWTVVGFHDEAAHTRWREPVKAAFRLLADTGFGGKRSRGWGRSEQPEFIEGSLPEMILPATQAGRGPDAGGRMPEEEGRMPGAGGRESSLSAEVRGLERPMPLVVEPPEPSKESEMQTASETPGPDPQHGHAGNDHDVPVSQWVPGPAPGPLLLAAGEPSPVPPIGEPPVEQPPVTEPMPGEPPLKDPHMPTPPPGEPGPDRDPDPQPPPPDPDPDPEPSPFPDPSPVFAAGIVDDTVAAEPEPPLQPASARDTSGYPARHPAPVQAHWLLSLFTPAPADSVDWARGNYAVQARGGRVDSPAGSGELKKQVQMVVEGSVLYADDAPHGAAADVAPDGFAHPVFRAGFALAIPLPGPEGSPS
jgi:CRISPR type III-A-associated RAMP protein Csm4